MLDSKLSSLLGSVVCLCCISVSALAQTSTPAAPATSSVAPAAQASATSSVAPAAPASATVVQAPSASTVAAPAAAAPVIVVPQGYALVPINGAGQTQYQVEYPQAQGALPPGMELPYESGDPVPEGYRVATQSRRGLVIAGSVVGGIAWGLSITSAVEANFDHKSGWLVAPVIGPWMMLAAGGAKDRCTYSTYDSGYCYKEDNSFLRSVLVLDGMAQLAAAAMLTFGVGYPTKRLVRKDVTVAMSPVHLGKDGFGVAATGQF
jgi:hypothetical protein